MFCSGYNTYSIKINISVVHFAYYILKEVRVCWLEYVCSL